MIIKLYRLQDPWINPADLHQLVFHVQLPLRWRISDARFQYVEPAGRFELALRVAQYGPACVSSRFLVVTHSPADPMEIELKLPRILLSKFDPDDSDDLQWSFWQRRRIGGTMQSDIFDVTNLTFRNWGVDAALPSE